MIRGLVLVLAVFLVAACGFRPVNAPNPGADAEANAVNAAESGQVRVARIPDRVGQLVHNGLSARLNPEGYPYEPRYVLSVSLDEQIRETGFRLDETATRANLEIDARYELRDAETGERLMRGRMNSINSANILDQPYATTVVERDARERGAEDVAEKIARDIRSWLQTQSR